MKLDRELRQRDLTLGELSKYTGKKGAPAYVAVNGVIYDVTNNAACSSLAAGVRLPGWTVLSGSGMNMSIGR